MKIKTAVITAAGFGTRFLPIVKEIPKEMLPIIDKPIIQYVVEECLDAQLEKIIIVVRKGNNVINNYFRKSVPEVRDLLASVGKQDRFEEVERLMDFKGIEIIEQRTDLPYGNGSPVLSAQPYLPEGEPFAVLFADDLVLSKSISCIAQLIQYYESDTMDGVIGIQRIPKEEVHKYGIIKPKEVITETRGQIDSIVEKPATEDAPSNLTIYGRYILPYHVLDILSEVQTGLDNELWLNDAVHKIAQTGKFMYTETDGEWLTTGDPINYFRTLVKYYKSNNVYGEKANQIIEELSRE